MSHEDQPINGAAVFTPPELPTATADVAELGGSVEIRGFLFSERLAFGRLLKSLERNGEANGSDTLAVTDDDLFPPHLLARTVYRDGKPLMTAEQWELFGARHMSIVMDLFWTAYRTCGFDEKANAGN